MLKIEGVSAYHAADGTRRPDRKAQAMRSKGTVTKYPGVYMVNRDRFYLRARVVDPRTGQKKEVDRVVQAASAREAAALRAELIESFATGPATGRVRVGDFARSWIESKTRLVDSQTIEGYTSALENHILPALGSFYYDALRPADVQAWINSSLGQKWESWQKKAKSDAEGEAKPARPYSVTSVHSWFRVLRNMTRDAIAQLDLQRDPTTRVTFPDRDQREGSNALTGGELASFLETMRVKSPHNYALAATLAFTGLRFCHASALRWEDIDEEKAVIHIQRKQSRGEVGPVSRRKRAPRTLPLVPELASVLREQRSKLLTEQAPGFDSGWCFPSEAGTLRTPGSLVKAWRSCAKAAKIEGRFTPHGLRRTFNDLARRAGVDAVVTKAITGHVTEQMREHYSSVALDEKRAAISNVVRLVPRATSTAQVGETVGECSEKKKAG